MIRFMLLLLVLIALPLRAEEVVLGLSKDKVAITANFDGSDILIYGAVKREAAIPDGNELGVVIAIAGPSEPLTVRRKEKKLGIWVNTDAVEVDSAPSFYAVATSAPFDEVMRDVEDLRYKVSIPRAIRSVGAPSNILDAGSFSDAVIRIREANALYQLLEGAVDVREQTLFSTRIDMPANLSEGNYEARIFLTRDGLVVSDYTATIDVAKVGLERWLFNLSREQPLMYGLMSLAIAIGAGWLASAVFNLFRA